MYPVSSHGARYSFLLLVTVALALSACSSRPAPTVVSIEKGALEVQRCSKLSGNRTPIVYSCSIASGDVFLSTLKDCSIGEKFSFQATTRQLLVGLAGMKMVSQSPVKLGQVPALQSVVQGTIDAEPIVMSTFTFRRGRCINDMIFWRAASPSTSESPEVATFSDEVRRLANSLISESHLGEDVSRVAG